MGQRNRSAARWIVGGLAICLLLPACQLTKLPPGKDVATLLKVSTSPTRANPANLNGSNLNGTFYVFVDQSLNPQITKVDFYIDQAYGTKDCCKINRTETTAPFDLMGSAAVTSDAPNGAHMADGTHIVLASITMKSGAVKEAAALFTVGASATTIKATTTTARQATTTLKATTTTAKPTTTLKPTTTTIVGGTAWPDAFNYLKQPGGISRTINGVTHTLPKAILGPVPASLAVYNGPKDWNGYPAIGDPYIDSLNFYALASCETGKPGGDPKGYAPDDTDAGGERFGAFQFAKGTWHYAADLQDNEAADPYQDPRDAPMWYQVMRSKRLMLKETIRGPGQAWRYPAETHHQSCGEMLFTGARPSTERIR